MDRTIQSLARAYRAEPTDEHAHKLARAATRSSGSDERVRKIVIATDHGGGWSSNARTLEGKRLMAEFPPLVEALEAADYVPEFDAPDPALQVTFAHPAVKALAKAAALLEGESGLASLFKSGWEGDLLPRFEVVEVTGPYRVSQSEGQETHWSPADHDWC